MSTLSSMPDCVSSRYCVIEKIGEGTYGVVSKAYDRENNSFVAIKKIRVETFVDGVPSTSLREISLLKNLSHENIIPLKNVVINDNRLFLIFDFMDEGDLKNFMDNYRSPIPLKFIKSVVFQCLKALHFCHSSRLLHRDLKPHNILLKSDGTVKLGDFGLSRHFPLPTHPLTHEVMTMWYRAPEILLNAEPYDMAVDVWSLGCIFAEMFKKQAIFKGDSEIHQLFEIFQVLGTPTPVDWPRCNRLPSWNARFPTFKKKPLMNLLPNLDEYSDRLINDMLIVNPSNRITTTDLLKDLYFSEAKKVSFFELEVLAEVEDGKRMMDLESMESMSD